MCKHIIPRELLQPQMLNVGTDRRDDQKNRHADAKKDRIIPVSFPVPEEQVNQHRRKIKNGELLRDMNKRTKRDIIIYRHMDDPVIRMSPVFQKSESDQINGSEQYNRQRMSVFSVKCFQVSISFSQTKRSFPFSTVTVTASVLAGTSPSV